MDEKMFKKFLKESFIKYLNTDLSDDKLDKFFDYKSLLIKTNEVMNLTSIVDDEGVAIKHFIDSCELIKHTFFIKNDNNYQKTAIDVGTGAGFPGLPMAILCENVNFTLTDSLNKRLGFLSDVIDKLSLKNVNLVHARAEDLGHDMKYREKYDVALARGVSRLNILFEYLSPFVKVNGKVLVHKLSDIDDEIIEANNSMNKLNIKYIDKINYVLYDDEPKRAIYEFEKIKNLNNIYPRKAGLPKKNPL